VKRRAPIVRTIPRLSHQDIRQRLRHRESRDGVYVISTSRAVDDRLAGGPSGDAATAGFQKLGLDPEWSRSS